MQVTADNVTVTIKELPFSNTFTASNAKLVTTQGITELQLVATCTATSKEPGRKYACFYTLQGMLDSCYTLN
jgi:hypothetical protein